MHLYMDRDLSWVLLYNRTEANNYLEEGKKITLENKNENLQLQDFELLFFDWER